MDEKEERKWEQINRRTSLFLRGSRFYEKTQEEEVST